jgi:hypothetical protein
MRQGLQLSLMLGTIVLRVAAGGSAATQVDFARLSPRQLFLVRQAIDHWQQMVGVPPFARWPFSTSVSKSAWAGIGER